MIKTDRLKRIASFWMALLLLVSAILFASCEKGEDVLTLSFAEANTVEEMQKNDGKKVSVIGYMSTLSPINGEFMYLMNLPYQSCPFCIPNTTQLSNTSAVYAKDGKSFEFTDLLIKVEGVLEFGEYTDEYGYQYSYRINDASYTKVDTSELSEEFILWQQIAQTGVVADIYSMYDYVSFVCFWGTYSVQIEGVKSYLSPVYAHAYLTTEGAQFNYGYKEGYFDGLVARIEAVDANAFADLVANIRRAEALAKRGLEALEKGEYTVVPEYTSFFGDGRDQYKLNDHDAMLAEFNASADEFIGWIGEWEIK